MTYFIKTFLSILCFFFIIYHNIHFSKQKLGNSFLPRNLLHTSVFISIFLLLEIFFWNKYPFVLFSSGFMSFKIPYKIVQMVPLTSIHFALLFPSFQVTVLRFLLFWFLHYQNPKLPLIRVVQKVSRLFFVWALLLIVHT